MKEFKANSEVENYSVFDERAQEYAQRLVKAEQEISQIRNNITSLEANLSGLENEAGKFDTEKSRELFEATKEFNLMLLKNEQEVLEKMLLIKDSLAEQMRLMEKMKKLADNAIAAADTKVVN
jgi:hypothetical protein